MKDGYNCNQADRRLHQFQTNPHIPNPRKMMSNSFYSSTSQGFYNPHNRGLSQKILPRTHLNKQKTTANPSYGQSLKDQILSPGDEIRNEYSKERYTPFGINNPNSNLFNNKTRNPYSPQKFDSSLNNRSTSGSFLPPHTKNNKKTLVLDLDETLVHSAFKPFYFKSDIMLNVYVDRANHPVHVLKRPYVDSFLERMAQHYELVVFTASISQYANPLLDQLDKRHLITHRLFREHCVSANGLYIKDLKRLGRNLKDMIIVDNNPVSYAVNQENGIPVLTWHYDKTDSELLKLIPLLEYLAYVDDVRAFIMKGVTNNVVNFDYANELINKANEISQTKVNNTINDNTNKLQSSNHNYQSQMQLHLPMQSQTQYGLMTHQDKQANKSASSMSTFNNYVEPLNPTQQKWRTNTPGPYNIRKNQIDEEKNEATPIQNQHIQRRDNKIDMSPNRIMSYTPKMNYRNNDNYNNANSTQSYTGYYNNRKGIKNEYKSDFGIIDQSKKPNISPNININIVNHNISNYPNDQLNKKYETISKGNEVFNPFVPQKYDNKTDYTANIIEKQKRNKIEDNEDEDESSEIKSLDDNLSLSKNNIQSLQNRTIPTSISTSNMSSYSPSQNKNLYQYYSQPNTNFQNNLSNNQSLKIIQTSSPSRLNQFKKIDNYENENSRNLNINHSYTNSAHLEKKDENNNYYSNIQDKYSYINNPNLNINQNSISNNSSEQFYYRPTNQERERERERDRDRDINNDRESEQFYSDYTKNQLKQTDSFKMGINMRANYPSSYISPLRLPSYQERLSSPYQQRQQDYDYEFEQRTIPYPLYKSQSIPLNSNYQQHQRIVSNPTDVYRQNQYEYQPNFHPNDNSLPLASKSIDIIQQSNVLDNHNQQPHSLNYSRSIQSINRDEREINPNSNQIEHNYYNQPPRDYIPYKRVYNNNYLGYNDNNSTYYDQIRDSYY